MDNPRPSLNGARESSINAQQRRQQQRSRQQRSSSNEVAGAAHRETPHQREIRDIVRRTHRSIEDVQQDILNRMPVVGLWDQRTGRLLGVLGRQAGVTNGGRILPPPAARTR